MSGEESRATWETRYGAAPVWSGKVNDAVRLWGEQHRPEVGDSALDLACGEGGDALWLASKGWEVTGVDFAKNALDRASLAAQEAGLSAHWIRADLAAWEPDAAYRLVTLSFFHEAQAVRHAVWRVAALAVGQGGTLLITAHAPDPSPDAPGPPSHTRFPLSELVTVIGEDWALGYREVRREGIGRHAGHIVTDAVAEFTRK
ncbi:MAG: class I SAM-dependent methyltransferase [Demequinaceae bacterium]|nr:class I SAM-dependent methyltransferase [Demequinaceae bacterium]